MDIRRKVSYTHRLSPISEEAHIVFLAIIGTSKFILYRKLPVNLLNHSICTRYWCVLSKGQLQEYTNWKHQLQTHNQPILLKLATVKEAREAGRRFCFEVITPNVRRVYQATSSEELSSWMATINNAICGSLNGTGSCAAFFEDVSAPLPDWSPEKTISKALDGIAKLKPKKSRRRKERLSQSYDKLQTIKSSSCNGSWLLKQLCQQDPSNSFCADCSAQNPDWCSLNFGILLCIGKQDGCYLTINMY